MKRVLFFVVALAWNSSLLGQEFRAGLSGIATDTQGAVMANVEIVARNLETNRVDKAVTNQSGYYSIPVLSAGNYRVTASAAGFKSSVRDKLELRGGDRVELDFKLEVGTILEQVTVTGEAELLDTTTASGGQVVGEEKVRDLPTIGRNPYLLAVIASGVMFDIGEGQLSMAGRPFDAGNNIGESTSINGGQKGSSDLLLDGSPNTATETTSPSNTGFVPSPDAVQQFKIQTNTYDAQYGRTSGGVVSVSLKSGTNKLKGVVYEYFRNDILNGNLFQSNRIGSPRSAFHWNQPGFQFDGPVVIPRVYNGRNKTFFMYSYEMVRSTIPTAVTNSVPMPDQLKGDFNTTLQTNGRPITIYDPLTTAETTPGTWRRQPFANNRIPTDRMNPVSLKMASYLPAPNVPGATTQNLIASPNPRADKYDSHAIKIDQVISDRNRFFARFVRGNRHEVRGFGGYEEPASPYFTHQRQNQGANFDLTSMITPQLLLTSRFGWTRHKFTIDLYSGNFDMASLGFPASFIRQLPYQTFPQIQMTNLTAFGAGRNRGNELTFSDTWSWSETANRTYRAHSLKFGGEARVSLNNQNSPMSNAGYFSFTNAFTQANALSGDSASGNAVASFLLGMPASGAVSINAAKAYGYRYYGLFVQDDWRIRKNITLNLGLRWDYESPVTERFNQLNAGFDFNSASPIKAPGLNLKGGLVFAGENNRLTYRRDFNNLQPRIGLAWQLNRKTVLRTGYGRSYFATFTNTGNQGFNLDTPYVATDGAVLANTNRISNPYPEGIRMPYGRSLGLATMAGQSVTFTVRERRVPHVHQFSFGLQRELRWRAVLDASYVGSRSFDLETSQNINEVTAAQMASYGSRLASSVANPFAGLLPQTSLNGATTSQQQVLRPYPQFTGIAQQRNPVGRSWYNSLQLKVDKRLSHGLNVLASYTYSKNLESVGYLNSQDPITSPSRTLNANDTPHRLTVSGGWAFPFFKSAKGVTGLFLRGWQANAIFIRQVGFPLAAPSGYYSSGIDPALPKDERTKMRYFNTCVITTSGARQNCASATEPAAFIQQPAYTLRVLSSRFPSIRPPKVPNLDISMFKMVTVRERLRIQFRAEALNATNSPQLGSPSTSLATTTAGQMTLNQVNDPRNIQLALRFQF